MGISLIFDAICLVLDWFFVGNELVLEANGTIHANWVFCCI